MLKDFGIGDFVRVSNMSFLLMIYTILLLGIFSSILIVFMPTIDETFLKSMLNYLLAKYQSLDENQKVEIREIFRDVFVDTSTAQILDTN
jgi:hypothetical protein